MKEMAQIRWKDAIKKVTKHLKVVITSMLIVMLLQTFAVVKGTLDDIWREHQIPYNIKWSYLSSMYVANLRVKLQDKGYEKEGLVLRKLKNLHKNLYQNMLEEIPTDDGLRIVLWYYYDLYPHIATNAPYDPTFYMNAMLRTLKQISDLKSRSQYIQGFKRFITCEGIISFFVSTKNSSLLQNLYKEWLPQVIYYSDNLAKEANSSERLLKHRDTTAAPFSLMINGYLANLEWVFIQFNILDRDINCTAPEIKKLQYYMNIIPELHLKYKHIKHIDSRNKILFQDSYNTFENGFPHLKSFLSKACGIKVKYNSFPIEE
ncbi:hypothetical protein NF27_CS00030 [Candidatus Jidaibacter acanthamoeba]|uniref:Uncharacterized protein n=1 Tax=Candidatus Jidaibacter acanthamoebae TaxID=86105 RepID=A0A0C1N0E9_9RICK|nr:hypothetical protein [Candidatus Jidaibacter acanthamoeba]KIE05791.1 hypothetical protein NF27_CS00030 [Candidatus Jidaibacter acanthamoeba]